jgi:hypothetical protein
MLYALVLSFIGKKWQRGVFALLLSCFVVASFNNFLLQNKLWLKTESLAINFRENEAIRNGRSFLVDDFADHLNTSYIIQGYTLNQLMKSSFNNEQTRFAITRIELQELYNEKKDYKKVVAHFTSIGQFSMKDYKLADFDYNLIIGEGDVVLTDLYSLKLLFYSYFNRQKFEEKVKPVISVKLSPCTGCPKLTE